MHDVYYGVCSIETVSEGANNLLHILLATTRLGGMGYTEILLVFRYLISLSNHLVDCFIESDLIRSAVSV